MFLEIGLIAYIIDSVFGEFPFIRHPVVLMGSFIKFYEKKFYNKSVIRGVILTLSLITIVLFITRLISFFISNEIILGIIASTTISSKMLYDSVKEIIDKPKKIKFLVSRDTKNLSNSEINKAAIETYAENLSDGVIAPLFYLLIFGISGAFVYKAVNTLDSMVGYRNEKYEKFGKFPAKLDDLLNYIPARITAFLIALLFFKWKIFTLAAFQGAKHDSPNAGFPIAAMGLAIGVKLGGATSYFGKIKNKPIFGCKKNIVSKLDIKNALKFQLKLNIFIIVFLCLNLDIDFFHNILSLLHISIIHINF
jgi:adenosylcobinamide-phosphate synthase